MSVPPQRPPDDAGRPPVVSPTPRLVEPSAAAVPLTGRPVRIVADAVDPATVELVELVLGDAGGQVSLAAVGDPAAPGVRVLIGGAGSAITTRALQGLRLDVPELPAEGYALAVDGRTDPGTVVVAGADGDGLNYAAQTLRQLMVTREGQTALAAVRVVDYPAIAVRGTIERSRLGSWSHHDRLDQLTFHGDLRLNTYVYAPIDDPFRSSRWRDPYPPEQVARIAELVRHAAAHHVRFAWGIAPGREDGASDGPTSGDAFCFDRPEDSIALLRKLVSLQAVGVRDFVLLLDRLASDEWGCTEDARRRGPADGAMARAHVELANRIQRGLATADASTRPLLVVPPPDAPNLPAWRADAPEPLEPAIRIGWPAPEVRPEVTVADARRTARAFGRHPVLVDEFPANDRPEAAGRLLMAPYRRREAGIAEELSGVLVEPMRQASASKVALFTVADFAWNDRAYAAGSSWRRSARYLVGDVAGIAEVREADPAPAPDPAGERNGAAEEAVIAFCDLSYLAPRPLQLPTGGSGWRGVAGRGLASVLRAAPREMSDRLASHWLPQAPLLRRESEQFWRTWEAGDPRVALAGLRPVATRLAEAPAIVRARVADPGFLVETAPWLEAAELWGRALEAATQALAAGLDGGPERGEAKAAEARRLVAAARAVRVTPDGDPIRLGDGVLDELVSRLLRARQ